MRDRIGRANHATVGVEKLLAVTALTSATLDLMSAPPALDAGAGNGAGPGLLVLREAPYAMLRAYFGATGKTATLDVIGYPLRHRKGIHLARLALTSGGTTAAGGLASGDPGERTPGVSTSFYEAGLVDQTGGLAQCQVRSSVDGPLLIYVPACECASIGVQVQAVGDTTPLRVYGAPVLDIPELRETPFTGAKNASAAALTNEVVDDLAGADLAVAGLGFEYVVRDLFVSSSGGVTVTLLNASGTAVWGPHAFPAGAQQMRVEIPLGSNKQPLLTASSFTGRIELGGVIRPVQP